MTPKRRAEDNNLMSYKTLSIGAVALLCTVIGHLYLSDLSSLKEDLRKIKQDTAVIPLVLFRINTQEKRVDKIEEKITKVEGRLEGHINANN